MSGRGISVNFLDFEKGFDSVHRTSLWKILRQYGIPQKIVNIITLFYNHFTSCVQNSTSSFAVNSGVRQGCVSIHSDYRLAYEEWHRAGENFHLVEAAYEVGRPTFC